MTTDQEERCLDPECGHVGYVLERTNFYTQAVSPTAMRVLLQHVVRCPRCGIKWVKAGEALSTTEKAQEADAAFAVHDAERLLGEARQ